MKLAALALTCGAVAAALAACSGPPPSTQPVMVAPQDMSTPPPMTTTPVPIVRSRTVPNSGRVDPFVALFGPPTATNTPPPKVAVSSFPNIPTLPGFESAPGAGGIWQNVKLTGIFEHNGYVAILEDNGKSYFVRPGDSVDDEFRVISIGPDYITLGTQTEERHFSLGG
jgi:hypothetical protein